MKTSAHAASLAPFPAIESAIRATGARVTPSRVRVYALLQNAQGPLCHRDIERLLSGGALPAMDRVTLYRVLDWLAAAGLAHKAADARGVFRFSAATSDGEHLHHMHFRCTACAGVFCLDMSQPSLPELPLGFRLASAEFDIRGVCPDCAGKHP